MLRLVVWTTPNNVLYEGSYSDIIVQDFVIGSFLGFVFAKLAYKKQRIFQPKLLYWSTLVVSCMLAITPIAFLFMFIIGVLYFGVTPV